MPPPWEPAAKPARSHGGLEAFGSHTPHSLDGGIAYKPLTRGWVLFTLSKRKNVGLIDAPGPVGWLEMTAQPLLQFRTVALDPAPDCRVVCLQAALAEQLFDIAERERVPQVPAHGAKNQLGLGLSPLEDRRSDCLFHDLFRFASSLVP